MRALLGFDRELVALVAHLREDVAEAPVPR
jgi:hypothetical protein